MKVASLCSGYGGLEMGVALVEPVEVIWHAEYEPAPAQVHAYHWPDAPNVGDITTADWSELEAPDLLTAGYPCQPFSTAGRRKGTEDDRHLWPHVAEAIRTLRPRSVLLENVAGHLTLGFDVVAGDLAAMGYEFRWGCVRASDAGAPHHRERVFIVASDAGRERHGRTENGPVVGRLDGTDEGEARQRQRAWQVVGDRGNAVASDPCRCGRDGFETVPVGQREHDWPERGREQGDGDAEPCGCRVDWRLYELAIRRWEHLTRPAPSPTDDRGRLSPAFVEWMMGLPAGHVTGHGLPRTAELKMLGNGVVPQAAAIAWRCLATAYRQQGVA